MISYELSILEIMKNDAVFPQHLLDWTIEYLEDLEDFGAQIGDQDNKPIIKAQYSSSLIYGLKNENSITSFVSIDSKKDENGFNKIGITYTIPEYQSKKDIQRIFFFIKEYEKLHLISSGVQSSLGKKMIQSLDKTERFDMNWFNIKTKEKIKYDHTDDNEYRNLSSPTNWRIIIEHAKDPIMESRFMDLSMKLACMFDDNKESDLYA